MLDRHGSFDERRKTALVRVSPHDDDGLIDVTTGLSEVPDPQIAVRRQPAVQQHLLRTHQLPRPRVTEVQEVGEYRLLDLVRPVADQNHYARVGLMNLDSIQQHPARSSQSAAGNR